jgi:hypothetical protein
MRKTIKRLAITGAMAAALPLGVLAGTAGAAPAHASTIPRSPDGIYDARFCSDTSYFDVYDGTYDHAFRQLGAPQNEGSGVVRHWNEAVWWLGLIQVGGYNFYLPCDY